MYIAKILNDTISWTIHLNAVILCMKYDEGLIRWT